MKPANIFLLESGQVKVLDFGLAKLRVEPFMTGSGRAVAEVGDSIELTSAGIISGTIAHSSPEQR